LATKHYDKMSNSINPKIGDLVIWNNGRVGILYERVDLYVHMKVSSRNYSPRWHWLINFSDEDPWDYSSILGISEKGLLDGTFGKLIKGDINE